MDQPKPQRRRAKRSDGTFEGNPQSAPDVNTAWEPTEVSEALIDKDVKYSVKPKVEGTSNDTAGKYSRKPKVRPTFGAVYTTYSED